MALFGRGRPRTGDADADAEALAEEPDADVVTTTTTRPPGPDELARVAGAVSALEADGVDVDDPASLGAAFDAALARHRDSPIDHDVVVERIGLGIGEHVARHTPMVWSVISDPFGTDLGVAGTRASDVVIPTNIVAARWLNGESGWVPGVVAHLVRRAQRG